MNQAPDKDIAQYPGDEETVIDLVAWAERLPGLDLKRLGYDPEGARPGVRARTKTKATALAGVISWAYDSVLGELFQDYTILLAGGTASGTLQLSRLPEVYASRYDSYFVQRFIAVAVDLGTAMVAGFGHPTCVAQELALRLVLNRASDFEWTYSLDLADNWRSDVEDALFEDDDHEMLYCLWADGLGDDVASSGQLDVANLDFANWFSAFTDHQHVNPYCFD